MTYFSKEFADGWPEETKYNSEELARLAAKEGIKHLQLQLRGERAPGVVSWVYDVGDWRGYALAIPELDIHSLQRDGVDFNFYTVDREKMKVNEPVKRFQVRRPSGLVTTEQQIENITQEFYKDELVLIRKMIGKAALLGTPHNNIDGPVHQSLTEEYLDSLAKTFGNGHKECHYECEPYEQAEFIEAAKENIYEQPGFKDRPLEICYKLEVDGEIYFINLSSSCGVLESCTLIKQRRDGSLVNDSVEYQLDEEKSEYSGFWELDKLVKTLQMGTEISIEDFNSILQISDFINDIS